jgi:hypothetical protein
MKEFLDIASETAPFIATAVILAGAGYGFILGLGERR